MLLNSRLRLLLDLFSLARVVAAQVAHTLHLAHTLILTLSLNLGLIVVTVLGLPLHLLHYLTSGWLLVTSWLDSLLLWCNVFVVTFFLTHTSSMILAFVKVVSEMFLCDDLVVMNAILERQGHTWHRQGKTWSATHRVDVLLSVYKDILLVLFRATGWFILATHHSCHLWSHFILRNLFSDS